MCKHAILIEGLSGSGSTDFVMENLFTLNGLVGIAFFLLFRGVVYQTSFSRLLPVLTRSKFDHSSRQILILHFRTSFRTTEADYRLAAAIAPRAIN